MLSGFGNYLYIFVVMNRQRFSILFMVVTIAVIAAFQVFWMQKNYSETKKLFTTRCSILFRETVFKLQASMLKLDTNIRIRMQEKAGIITMSNVLQERIKDSTRSDTNIRTMFVQLSSHSKDTPAHDVSHSQNKIYDFFIDVDSVQKLITVHDVYDRYKQALSREGIPVSFHIDTFKGDTLKDFELPEDLLDNKVRIGFKHPVVYRLELDNISWYIMKQLKTQLFFSLLLIGMTILSFLLLYRNWLKQKKLAQLKSNFISNITHELKTPIATVNVAIEALRNFGGIRDPEKTREYLDISASELQRLSLLVDKILKLSMLENREIKLSKEEFDLKALIQEVIDTLKFRFERHNATVEFTTEGEHFTIDGDKLHLTSVIYNLLDNALKYSKENPVIRIHLSAPRENILELKIADNGIGIAREYQSKIFDKFFRVPTNNRHDVKGYGLGLSYVSEIIKRHMGFIRVESEPDKGSTFIAILPVREAPVIYIDEHRRIIKKTIKIS